MPREIDPDRLKAMALRVWGYRQGEVVALMIHLGDRLGLYKALADGVPVAPHELAERTGLHPRWVLEWLRGQAAARVVEYEDGLFSLTPEGVALLADDEGSIHFAAGAFGPPTPEHVVDGLAEAFRTGVGLPFDALGPAAAHRTERTLGPWSRLALVPVILPALEGVVPKLEAGARMVDVGCGAGVALIAMAAAFPRSEFHGYDPSVHAIERARTRVAEAGVGNAFLRQAGGEDLPRDHSFDFVTTFDCLHDMTHPERVIRAIRSAIADDGTWLIGDIRSARTFEQNLDKNPMLAMLYGFSVSTCMSAALSEPGGAGLGTLGFNSAVAQQMTAAAGFSRFRKHDFDNPANVYYEVRP